MCALVWTVVSMWLCDELPTCLVCHSAFALWQLEEAPADPCGLECSTCRSLQRYESCPISSYYQPDVFPSFLQSLWDKRQNAASYTLTVYAFGQCGQPASIWVDVGRSDERKWIDDGWIDWPMDRWNTKTTKTTRSSLAFLLDKEKNVIIFIDFQRRRWFASLLLHQQTTSQGCCRCHHND